MKNEKIKIVRWPDFTEILYDDYLREIHYWSWKSDDYEIIEVDEDDYNRGDY